MDKAERERATARVQEFYDGPADTIYRTTWGEDLHLAVRRAKGDTHEEAMRRTSEIMASHLRLEKGSEVLDLGSGYGAPARYLASRFGARVTGLNVSSVEIDLARRLTRAAGLDRQVSFDHGDFHDLPYADDSFDVVWSQASLMYGADKHRILAEAYRVMKPSGVLDFTDILASRGLAPSERERLYERVRTPEMWDIEAYLRHLIDLGFKIVRVEDWSEHVAWTYTCARDRALEHRPTLEAEVGEAMMQTTLDGLAFWIEMAERGKVGWALFVARRPG